MILSTLALHLSHAVCRRDRYALALMLMLPVCALSQTPSVTLNRYARQLAIPAVEQRYPLASLARFRFAEREVHSIGQALTRVLHGTGYTPIPATNAYVRALLQKPLPDNHRTLGPLSIAATLQTLVGSAYGVWVNDVTREVRIDIAPGIDPERATLLPATLTQRPNRSTAPPESIPQPPAVPSRARHASTRRFVPPESSR